MRTYNILLAGRGLVLREESLREHFRKTRPTWTLRFASDGAEARRALADGAFEAAVLDLALAPEGDGLRLLREIRHACPTTALIIACPADRAGLLRSALPEEGVGEDAAHADLDPESVLLAEELDASGAAGVLESRLARTLYRTGHVENDTGVLITHGTDTMAWGFAYLRYALRDLKANVAMTGSQIPLGGYFTESDALGNLRTAVFLLNRLRPARLFAVFNNGRSVFSGRLTKYRKWDSDAFEGRMIASATTGSVRPLRKDWVYIPHEDQRLERLHLVRTGGTIESQRGADAEGGLAPSGDFVSKYLTDSFGGSFAALERHDLFALDSSNMSCEDWAQIAKTLEAIGVAKADTRFDTAVKPVFCNPLFTTDDYRAQFAACGAGAVLAGFGGGNANVRKDSAHSILPALKAAVEAGTFVAVTSQVPLEPYDAEYETGLALLEAGGIPCGDLPLADAQIKLAYLLGHRAVIEEKAGAWRLEPRRLTAAAFLSGVAMRRPEHPLTLRGTGGRCMPLRTLHHDPFATGPFEYALEAVAEALTD